jgi:hypothetical protein
MAKITLTDSTRHRAALHDAIADTWEAYLKRPRVHAIRSPNILRRRINIHRAMAAKLRG